MFLGGTPQNQLPKQRQFIKMQAMIRFCKYSEELKTCTHFGSSFFNGHAEQTFFLLKAKRN